MKFFIITLGCKVNQYESEAMHKKMEQKGFEEAKEYCDADVVIINSCTVTAKSDQKVRQTLNKVRRESKDAIVVLTGCMPQAFPELVSDLDADIILGNSNRSNIVDYIEKFLLSKSKIVDIKPHENNEKFETLEISDFHQRTRAFIKIEDGCNRFCSYCIIPYARGRVRSKPIEDIKEEVKTLSSKGYKEVVLVGINLSAYKTEDGLKLCDVVKEVCSINGIERVRLGSLEPDQIDEDTIRNFSLEKKFCPQFHLSLQSGCDETLKRMNRHYNTSEYFDIIKNIRKYFDNASITTDVMVGFAGETEEEFSNSLAFVEKVGFSKVHVFPYSRRPGTRAASFVGQITNAQKKDRSERMIELTNKTRKNFMNQQIGKVEEVLFETSPQKNVYEGYTKNYTPIRAVSSVDIRGMILNAEVKSVEGDYCIAKILD